MAKKATIPITDHADNCTSYYLVAYKLHDAGSYTSLPYQFTDTVEITNLQDSSTYDVQITRYCCNGLQSDPLSLTLTT